MILLVAAALAACPAPSTLAQVRAAVEDAELSYARHDAERFGAARAALDAALPCLTERIDAAMAARVHRAEAFAAFVTDRPSRVAEAFHGVRHADPSATLSTTYALDGHPLQVAWAASATPVAGASTIPRVRGVVLVDGVVARSRPEGAAVLVQYVDSTGAVRDTRYLWPDDPLPDWPRAAPAGLVWGSVAGGVAAGALLGGAAITRVEYDALERTPTNEGALESLYEADHALVISGAALGLIAAVGATAALTIRW